MGSKNRFQKKAELIEEKKASSSGFNEQIKQLDETVELKSLAIHNGSEKSLSVMAMIEKHLFNNSIDTICARSNVLNRSFYKCNLGIPYEFK